MQRLATERKRSYDSPTETRPSSQTVTRGCADAAWVREMELARALVVDANGGFGELVSRLAREADVLVAV